MIIAFMLWKGLHVPWPPTKSPDSPGCAWFQTFRVSCINALLLCRCRDLFLVGKTGHLRTTSLVSLVVAGMPGLTGGPVECQHGQALTHPLPVSGRPDPGRPDSHQDQGSHRPAGEANTHCPLVTMSPPATEGGCPAILWPVGEAGLYLVLEGPPPSQLRRDEHSLPFSLKTPVQPVAPSLWWENKTLAGGAGTF